MRADALAAVGAGDTGHIGVVVAALEDPARCGAAVAALGRLGDAVLPSVATALAATTVPVPGCDHPPCARGSVRSPEAAVDCHGGRTSNIRTANSASPSARRSRLPEWKRRQWRQTSSRPCAPTPSMPRVASPRSQPSRPRPFSSAPSAMSSKLLRERVLALLAARHGSEAIHLVALGLASDAEASARPRSKCWSDARAGRGGARLAGSTDRPARPCSPASARSACSGCSELSSAQRSPTSSSTPGGHWRSPWLGACAVYEARRAGSLLSPRRAAQASDPVLRGAGSPRGPSRSPG